MGNSEFLNMRSKSGANASIFEGVHTNKQTNLQALSFQKGTDIPTWHSNKLAMPDNIQSNTAENFTAL